MNIDVTRVDGAGFCEDSINCRGLISGKFYIGAYTTIAKTAHLNNTLIGRFSTVQENVSIGMHVPNGKMLSSHKFCYSPYPDDYLKGISTLRLFEHTQKYTFIGNDVLIGAGSVICDGVRIGDGAIVKPNSYIDFDVPDYAITDGRSHVFEYRFNEVMRRLLILSKWWKKKINIPSDKNTWYGDEELLLRICTQDFDPLEKKTLCR